MADRDVIKGVGFFFAGFFLGGGIQRSKRLYRRVGYCKLHVID